MANELTEEVLAIERLTETELSDLQWKYTKESIDAGFYTGKMETAHWRMKEMLTAEILIRMNAI